MASTITLHHVWWLAPAWGHHISAHASIAKFLEANDQLKITLLYHAITDDKVKADWDDYAKGIQDRLDLHILGSKDIPPSPTMMQTIMTDLFDGFNNAQYDVVPTKFVFDLFGGYNLVPGARERFPGCKVYLHWSPSASYLYTLVAPSPNGGGDYKEIVEKFAQGKSKEERSKIFEQVVSAHNGTLACNGTIVKVPGVPDMYDYEREQENVPALPGQMSNVAAMTDFAQDVDGVLAVTSHALEKEAIEAGAEYVNVIPVGVSVNPRAWIGAELKEDLVKGFLDGQEEKSVLFISFGSVFWPTAHLETLLEVLLDLKRPFFVAAGGRMAGKLDPIMADKVAKSGFGMFHQTWVDQIGILSHAAVGWFLSHAGWNSACEAILRGVPIIAWPLSHSDQALIAARWSTGTPQLGYELLEIRQGYALKPTKRGVDITGTKQAIEQEFRDTLIKAFGEEGQKIRRNVKAMSRAIREEARGEGVRVIADFAQA